MSKNNTPNPVRDRIDAAEKLRKIRDTERYTNGELSAILGVANSQVSNYLTGTNLPAGGRYLAIKAFVGLTRAERETKVAALRTSKPPKQARGAYRPSAERFQSFDVRLAGVEEDIKKILELLTLPQVTNSLLEEEPIAPTLPATVVNF